MTPRTTTCARLTLATFLLAAAATTPTIAAPQKAQHSPTVPAKSTFTFSGGGFGHGVGMPQYGAYGAARAGWSAAKIVGYYYRGAQLAKIQGGGAVRVAIAQGRSALAVSSATEWQIVDESQSPNVARALAPNVPYRLAPKGAGVSVAGTDGQILATFAGPVRLQPVAAGGAVQFGSSVYRGATRVTPSNGKLAATNIVELEDYLRGVLPREMPSRWGDDAPAALEAQAIAARTYAVSNLRPDRPYDLESDQRSQVYGGVSGEDPRTSRAVAATAGSILVYQGRPITAFFFSSSGGRTEDAQNVFPSSTPRPYLTGVADPFDAQYSPYNRWSEPPTFSGARLGKLLGLGPVTGVKITRTGTSGRVLMVRIARKSGGPVERTGAELRKALGLRDTLFTVTRTVTKKTLPA